MSNSRTTLALGLLALLATPLCAGQAAGDEAVASWSDPVAENLATDDELPTIASRCKLDFDLVRGQCDCQPTWVVNVGTLFLQRGTPAPTTLVHVAGNPGGVLINANSFTFNYAAGADVAAIRRVNGFDLFDAMDVRFFGVQSSQATLSTTTSQAWILPTNPLTGGGLTSGPIDVFFHSRIYSTEFNLRRSALGGRLTWLAGVRWIQLNEQLTFTGNFSGLIGNTATFNTQNNLYGGQVGADYLIWNHGPLSIDGIGKVGIFGNAAGGQSENNLASSSASASQIAFVGDLAITAIVQVTEHIAMRGGWQLLWIDGAATASNQVSAVNYHTASGINTAGNAFYQGVMTSVVVSW